MDLHFAERPFRIQSWGSREELSGFLSRCEGGSLFVEPEGAVQYLYSVTLHLDGPRAERFGVGLAATRPGAAPHLLLQPEQLRVLIGIGAEVIGIDASSRRIEFRVPCEGEFTQFVEVGSPEVILVFHQAGILAIAPNGSQLWSFASRRIIDWACEQETLFLRIESAPTVRLNVRTGEPVPRES